VNLESPYRGLAAFDDSELDALYVFGRERDSEIVVANLIASRLTVLYGPSGVGKSSLLLASVARALRKLPEQPLVLVFSSWSEPPESALARAIAEAAGIEPGSLVDVATRTQAERDVYLVLDQAEEYFTYHDTDDGFDEEEGTFTICSFWLVSALSEIGEHNLARDLCQKLLGYASPLHLYAEEIDPRSGRHLGNFPQAFTHLALINAVMHVIRADARIAAEQMPLSARSATDLIGDAES